MQKIRQGLRVWTESDAFHSFIMVVIVVNAVTLGLETSQTVNDRFGPLLSDIDTVAITIFVVELTLRIFAFSWRFFLNAWNIFDLLIVTITLPTGASSLTALRGLRALRIVRTMRILSMMPQLRAVVKALIDALPGMAAVIILLSLVYYVFAVMATTMFGASFPDWFGTIGASMYSLFQIMTLESWSMGIVRPVMKVYPYAWAFFVPFIIVTTFSVLNLFVGILVQTMQAAVEEEAEESLEDVRAILREQNESLARHVDALNAQLAELRQEIRQSGRQ